MHDRIKRARVTSLVTDPITRKATLEGAKEKNSRELYRDTFLRDIIQKASKASLKRARDTQTNFNPAVYDEVLEI